MVCGAGLVGDELLHADVTNSTNAQHDLSMVDLVFV
jgi:hypothetical protein